MLDTQFSVFIENLEGIVDKFKIINYIKIYEIHSEEGAIKEISVAL